MCELKRSRDAGLELLRVQRSGGVRPNQSHRAAVAIAGACRGPGASLGSAQSWPGQGRVSSERA